jgi:3-hydroxybutyryl-CoA dehydrogenase
MNRLLINRHTPFREILKQFADFEVTDLETEELPEAAEVDLLVDLTIAPTEFKEKIFHFFNEAAIISDLSVNDGEGLIKKHQSLRGALALGFASTGKAVESWGRDGDVHRLIEEILLPLGLKAQPVSTPGIGFHFPRTLSVIVNEAHYALSDQLASASDIDRAMRFGVNYPQGPFDWSRAIGKEKILWLLEELHSTTGDERYRPSPLLKD